MEYPMTPIELSKELGLLPEARAGKKVRDYLRARYPDHVPNARWLLNKEQADEVRAHFAARARR